MPLMHTGLGVVWGRNVGQRGRWRGAQLGREGLPVGSSKRGMLLKILAAGMEDVTALPHSLMQAASFP